MVAVVEGEDDPVQPDARCIEAQRLVLLECEEGAAVRDVCAARLVQLIDRSTVGGGVAPFVQRAELHTSRRRSRNGRQRDIFKTAGQPQPLHRHTPMVPPASTKKRVRKTPALRLRPLNCRHLVASEINSFLRQFIGRSPRSRPRARGARRDASERSLAAICLRPSLVEGF